MLTRENTANKTSRISQPIQPPSRPFKQIGIDDKWIIIGNDCLTQYAEAKALPDSTAVESSRSHQILREIHFPATQHPRGTHNRQRNAIHGGANSGHTTVQSYKPPENNCMPSADKRSQGAPQYDHHPHVCYVHQQRSQDLGPCVVSAYNTGVQETQMTPFRLIHGKAATTALDATLPKTTD